MKRLLVLLLLIIPASPLTAQPPVIDQSSDLLVVPAGDKFLRWHGHIGRSYFVQVSDTNNPLAKWTWAPIIESGNDELISYEVDGTADKGFFRLKHTDQLIGPNETLETADFDGDGLSNIDEIDPQPPLLASAATDPLHPDTDGDLMPDGWEVHNGLDPTTDDTTEDPDDDGLTNLQEFQTGTDPGDLDSDDDFMPDGWEVQNIGKTVIRSTPNQTTPAPPDEGETILETASVHLDPNDPSDAPPDPDQDGLTNIEEYRNGTEPNTDDTDGDGASVSEEVASGANPNDGSDGGIPGGPGSGTVVIEVPFAIGGDFAWWEMTIEARGPTDTREQKIHSSKAAEQGYGAYEGEAQMVKLYAGNTYRVTMKRMGGVEGDDGTKWYCWSANVGIDPGSDELLPLENTFDDVGYFEPGERLEDVAIAYAVTRESDDGKKATWVIDNSKGLFTQHIDDYGHDVVQSLEAFLVPVEVSWKAIDGFDNVDDHVDPWNKPIYGKRIFPDFKNPDESEIQHKLEVIVKTSQALAGKAIFVKAFDVDDSTSEQFDNDENGTTPVIDTNGKSGNDNLSDFLITPQNGQFWTGSAWGGQTAQGTVDANGETKFIFRVGMQPGSNYRVVTSVIDESMYGGVQVGDAEAPKYLGPSIDENGEAPASPLLTVWRKLWVENDSMEAIPTDTFGYKRNDLSWNLNPPQINNVSFISGGDSTSFGIPLITDETSFYNLENGRMILQSVTHSVTETASFQVTVAGDHSSVPVHSGFRLYDDDDIGLNAESLPKLNLVDDQMKNYFKPSFVAVTDASEFNPRKTVPLRLNEDVATNLYGQSSTVVDDARDLTDKNGLWVCPITAAYQGPMDVDCDPQIGESLRLGETASYGDYDHSTVFVECCRETFSGALPIPGMAGAANRNLKKWIVATVSHEMGHQPGSQTELEDHAELGLMTASLNSVSTTSPENSNFSAKTVFRFRKSTRWSK